MPFRDRARALVLMLVVLGLATSARASTLDDVKAKGFIQCGVNQGLPGFSNTDDKGDWTGIDVDVCRAAAAAIFGDPQKVKFTPLSTKERFAALQSGEIDVLSRNTSWTVSRDASLGLFTGVTYYDGQGFLARKALGVETALKLDGATICAQTGTTTELNVADYFRTNNLKYEIVVFEKGNEAIQAYESQRCDVFTSDVSQLYAQRLKLAKPDENVVLPEIISKEPLGPMVRFGDDQWFNVIKWALFAMINAEELDITQANVDSMKSSANPEIRRFLGLDGGFGQKLGLPNDWAFQVVKTVGNYGESFERNVGQGSPLKIKRGVNALWTKGGIQYAPPIR